MRRVAVTGLGLVTPLGVGVSSSWARLLAGESGLGPLVFGADGLRCSDGDDHASASEWAGALPCAVGASVPAGELAAARALALTNARAQDPGFIAMALVAAREAVLDAGLAALMEAGRLDPERAGVAISSGIGGSVEEVCAAHDLMRDNGPRRGVRKLSPYFVPRLLLNLAAGHVGIAHNLQGPNHSCVTACASGAHSIGDASRFIMFGDADVMVAGGTESTMNALSVAGFSRLKALSTRFNDDPQAASRPFDKHRDGFVMGEGAGIVVLEEMGHAKARGATIYAEVAGYGLSGDAFHLTAPAENGKGAKACMRSALRNSAGTLPSPLAAIDYVNAHATSTPLGDAVEAQAIAAVFADGGSGSGNGNGNGNGGPFVSSTKGATGHLLGAAGAVEAVFSVLSVANDVVPPTRNLCKEDMDMDPEVTAALRFVAGEARHGPVRAAMSNSFGFGGTNAALVFAKA